jgi:outer membrane protein assembly factor BamB
LLILNSGCATSKPAVTAAAAARPKAAGVDPAAFRQVWSDVLPVLKNDAISRVFVDQDVVIATTPNNILYSMAKPTGLLQFFAAVNGNGREIGRPVVLPKIMVITGQSNLEIYDRATGELKRSDALDFSISSNAVGAGDDVFFGADTAGGEVADVNLTATYVPIRWRLLSFGEVLGAPALYNSVLYFGSGDGGVYAVNDDHSAAWLLDHDRFDTNGPIIASVKADDAGVYAASSSGRLVCLDRGNGKLKWQYLAPRPLTDSPIVTRTSVYQLVPGLGLAAIDKSDPMAVDPDGRRKVQSLNRTPRWISPDAAQFVSEDRLFTYIRTNNNELWALDRATGQVRYRAQGIRFPAMATNITDSNIYAATEDGVIFAFKPVLEPGTPGYLD